MIVVTPAAIPVTMPVALPIDPAAGLVLLHVPPNTASPSAVVRPTHTLSVPVIGAAGRFTCTFIHVVSVPPLQSVTCTLKESRPAKAKVGVYHSPVGVMVLPDVVAL